MRVDIFIWVIIYLGILPINLEGHENLIQDTLSIESVIQNPNIYKNKVIQVKGFLATEYETRGLYPTVFSFKNRNFDSSLWVDSFHKNTIVSINGNEMTYKKFLKSCYKKSIEAIKSSNNKEVDVFRDTLQFKYHAIVKGTYNPCRKGHMGLFVNGSIENIKSVILNSVNQESLHH